MNSFIVWDSQRGKVFATLQEATAYANEIFHRFGVFCAVEETKRAVTHVYMIAAGK